MSELIIGKPFPETNMYEGAEGTTAPLNPLFFDVRYYKPAPTWQEKNAFNRGKFRYGLYKKNNIPFLILDFLKAGFFNVGINVFDLTYTEAIDNWLNLEHNIVNVYLINSVHNVLEARRRIAIRMDMAESIRDVLEKQSQEYSSWEAVSDMIDSIEVPTATMIERSRMVKG